MSTRSCFPYRFRITGMRLSDLLKFLIAVGFGFMLRAMTSCSIPECPACPDCVRMNIETDLLKSDLQFQLREAFKPKSMYEVLRYEHFSMTAISDNFDDDPQINLLGHQKSDIKDIVHQAMAMYNSGRPDKWQITKLINGYRRYDPLRGEEVILDVLLSPEKSNTHVEELHRLELVKPFGTAHLLNDNTAGEHKVIHFILPITGLSDKFKTFMQNFEDICLNQSKHVYLMIVLFLGKQPETGNDADKMKVIARGLTDKYPNAHIRIIQTRTPFSRAIGLDLGARQLPTDALLFFCDVDVRFDAESLDRCRMNAVAGKQVYYPIVFAQYNPDIVNKFSPEDRVKDLMKINKYTGHWVHYGFGMACMHNLDYRSVGGFNTNIAGWGGEDVDLYIKHVKSTLMIFRAMDPGLVHIYHDKACSANLTADQMRMCVDSRAEGTGSKQQLAKLVIDLESH
ncbi:hypothetical protein CAPTEDRAFT_168658 [Capitella teleta]|uniref:Hexosyltransferase n=1 Tax=Capitella teleta TaxID=283909 RepID=R7UKK5_CAPTE|nr:hypothetical protein CAPTEDRAFT_168658 [Capitella teleta]|eukprot:ELU06608.1 hypothetical protein CAPTEDRAFT_168658 [Capitella teleta]